MTWKLVMWTRMKMMKWQCGKGLVLLVLLVPKVQPEPKAVPKVQPQPKAMPKAMRKQMPKQMPKQQPHTKPKDTSNLFI